MVDKRNRTGQEVEAKMWNIHTDTKNSYTYYNYKMALCNATKAIRSAKRSLEKKKTCNIMNDPKALYRYARKKMKTTDSVGVLINANGDVIRDSPYVASMLSKYFASVFQLKILIIFPLSILQPIVT